MVYVTVDCLSVTVDCLCLQLFKALQRGQVSEEKVPNMIYLHTYLTYLRQTKTAERNLLMAESLKTNLRTARPEEGKKLTKPQDLARLYDIIIQVGG